jgi:hypothetical protein
MRKSAMRTKDAAASGSQPLLSGVSDGIWTYHFLTSKRSSFVQPISFSSLQRRDPRLRTMRWSLHSSQKSRPENSRSKKSPMPGQRIRIRNQLSRRWKWLLKRQRYDNESPQPVVMWRTGEWKWILRTFWRRSKSPVLSPHWSKHKGLTGASYPGYHRRMDCRDWQRIRVPGLCDE